MIYFVDESVEEEGEMIADLVGLSIVSENCILVSITFNRKIIYKIRVKAIAITQGLLEKLNEQTRPSQ